VSEYYLSGFISDDLTSVQIEDAPFLHRILNNLAGKKLEVRITEFFEQRSNRQNRYLWGVVIPLIIAFHKETQGEKLTPDDVYAFLMANIAEYKMVSKEIFGETVFVVQGKSTSKMNTQEFMEFIKKVQQYFDERGLEIPDPKNNNFLNDFI